MAKKQSCVIVALQCELCNSRNYTTYKNKKLEKKLDLKKYCRKCQKHTLHKETKLK